MTSREFVEQIAYYQRHPWGDDWLQAGVIAREAANANPYRRRLAKIEELMPKEAKARKPKQTVEQMTSMLRELAEQMKKGTPRGSQRQ